MCVSNLDVLALCASCIVVFFYACFWCCCFINRNDLKLKLHKHEFFELSKSDPQNVLWLCFKVCSKVITKTKHTCHPYKATSGYSCVIVLTLVHKQAAAYLSHATSTPLIPFPPPPQHQPILPTLLYRTRTRTAHNQQAYPVRQMLPKIHIRVSIRPADQGCVWLL